MLYKGYTIAPIGSMSSFSPISGYSVLGRKFRSVGEAQRYVDAYLNAVSQRQAEAQSKTQTKMGENVARSIGVSPEGTYKNKSASGDNSEGVGGSTTVPSGGSSGGGAVGSIGDSSGGGSIKGSGIGNLTEWMAEFAKNRGVSPQAMAVYDKDLGNIAKGRAEVNRLYDEAIKGIGRGYALGIGALAQNRAQRAEELRRMVGSGGLSLGAAEKAFTSGAREESKGTLGLLSAGLQAYSSMVGEKARSLLSYDTLEQRLHERALDYLAQVQTPFLYLSQLGAGSYAIARAT